MKFTLLLQLEVQGRAGRWPGALRIWTPNYQVVVLLRGQPSSFPEVGPERSGERFTAPFSDKAKPDPFAGYRVLMTWWRFALLRTYVPRRID